MELWTASQWYKGADRFDCTVMSGDKRFAPTWKMVTGVKDGSLTWSEYEKQYLELMRASYRQHRGAWMDLLEQPGIVFVCYCPTPEHCHRRLLAQIFVKLGKALGVEVVYRGELSKSEPRRQPASTGHKCSDCIHYNILVDCMRCE